MDVSSRAMNRYDTNVGFHTLLIKPMPSTRCGHSLVCIDILQAYFGMSLCTVISLLTGPLRSIYKYNVRHDVNSYTQYK
jgi:hypothetical protein